MPAEESFDDCALELRATSNRESISSAPSNRDRNQVTIYGELKPYQLTLITIGGAINTGLMIAFGNALSRSGPAATLISYTFVGLIVFLVLCALGEVASWCPEPTTVHAHANRFAGPSLGFTLGWIYWLKYTIVILNQLTAGVVIISYWREVKAGDAAAYITAFLAVIVSVNYWSSRFLGRYEVILSSFKVAMVIGLMILSLVIALGGAPDGEKKVFRYWKRPGAFAIEDDKTALGVVRSIMRSVPGTTFSYLGSELLGMALLHSQEPRKTAARAIKQTFYRILAFNLVAVTLLGMAIPYDEDALALTKNATARRASAFVVAVQMAHITVFPDILNACILVFVVSAASRALCMATRIMCDLSLEGNAPAFLHRTDKRGVPVYALGICSIPTLLGYLNLIKISGLLWGYLVNMAATFSILTWSSILITHIAFVRARKAHQVPPASEAPFKAPLGVVGSWIALALCIFMPVTRGIELSDRNFYNHGLDVGAFVTSFIGIPLYFGLVVGYEVTNRRKKHRHHKKVDSLTWQSERSTPSTETDHTGQSRVSSREKAMWRNRGIPVWLI